MPVAEAGVSSSISFPSWPNIFNTKKTLTSIVVSSEVFMRSNNVQNIFFKF